MTKNKKPVIDLHKTHDTTNKVVGLNHPVDAKTRAKKVVGI